MSPPEQPGEARGAPRGRDELDDYLRGDSALSRRYRREGAPLPAHSLDRRVLSMARGTHRTPPYLRPLALAASVLLSLAMIATLVLGPPRARRGEDAPRLIRTAMPANASLRLYSSDPYKLRSPAAWRRDIDALRRAGREREADAEYRRFLDAYPAFRAARAPRGFR